MAQVALELGHMALRRENYGECLVARAFELLDADAGVGFTIWHPRTKDIRAEVFGTRPLSEQEARRASAFTAAHPGFRAMARVQTNQPVRSDHTDMRRFWGTETYEAMHGHSDGRYPASAVLLASRAEVVFLGVHRQRRDFNDADMGALSILQRPIAAALAFRAALDETIDLLRNGENSLPHTPGGVSAGLRSPALNSAAV